MRKPRENRVNRIRDLSPGIGAALATCVFGLALICSAPHGNASDFQSPRTAALGGAGHAGPLLNDSIYLDPSYMAFLPTFAISGNYAWANYSDNSYRFKIQNASIQDGNPTDLFQAGIGYSRRDDGTLIHLGTAKQIITQRLSVGLGGKAYFPANNGFGAPPRTFDANFSATFIASESLQLSLLADNLVDDSTTQSYGFQREIIVGSKFNYQKILILYVDPHLFTSLDSGKYGYEAGIEFPMFSDLFLRGGMFHNATIPTETNQIRGNGYGLGFGWIAPKLSMDYGLSRSLYPSVGITQVVGFTAYM